MNSLAIENTCVYRMTKKSQLVGQKELQIQVHVTYMDSKHNIHV